MDSEDAVIPVFIPALVALLLRGEDLKGSALTREEAIAIRDNSECVMLPESARAEIEAKRGYSDIDPARCPGGMTARSWRNIKWREQWLKVFPVAGAGYAHCDGRDPALMRRAQAARVRGSSVTQTPVLGRSVTSPIGSTTWPGASRSR
jgi:hypothetical protein